jgi:hypothetical protein
MPRCEIDESLKRVEVDGFAFPLGVYPVEPMTPRPGFRTDFEPADGGGEDGQWEEWPDRYVFEIVIRAHRLEPLVRALLGLLPGRVFPILDVLGRDAYREVDPYISYDLLGLDRFIDDFRRFRAFFIEDGLCGFGAMADEPFFYFFVDEHKIITLRCEPEMKERVERVLLAFDLEQVEEPAGADAAAHEHRPVLYTPDDRIDLLDEDEITEYLRESWRLVLNVDPDSNLDEQGGELGITPWHCVVRCHKDRMSPPRYVDILLHARNLRQAEDLAFDAAEELTRDDPDWEDAAVVQCDRIDRETFNQWARAQPDAHSLKSDEPGIIFSRWIE